MMKKLAFATFLLVLLLSTMVGIKSVLAAVPGVIPGNEFNYDVKGIWTSTDPNATISASFLEINMTEWYRITINEVSGPDVKINTTWRFTNGTEVLGTGNVNVETGIYYPLQGFWAIYAANLNAGDSVRPTGPDRSTVNETVVRDYGPGGTRETNRLNQIFQDTDAGYTEFRTTYFDQQTGMLVDLHSQLVYADPAVTLTFVWEIKDTNAWTVPEFPVFLILPLFMIAIVLAALVYKKKHAHNAKTLTSHIMRN
jgi:hypothetical protein